MTTMTAIYKWNYGEGEGEEGHLLTGPHQPGAQRCLGLGFQGSDQLLGNL